MCYYSDSNVCVYGVHMNKQKPRVSLPPPLRGDRTHSPRAGAQAARVRRRGVDVACDAHRRGKLCSVHRLAAGAGPLARRRFPRVTTTAWRGRGREGADGQECREFCPLAFVQYGIY